MKRNIRMLVLALLGLCAMKGFGQSNERIDELLAQAPAQAGHTAYLVLSAAGIIGEDVSPEAAVQTAVERGVFKAETSASDPVTFGAFSYLLVNSFQVKGGVMYRLFPGRRYAAREVVYRQWSRKRWAPSDMVGGETVVRVLSVYLNEQGGQK